MMEYLHSATLPGNSLSGGVGLIAGLLVVAFTQTPRPSIRACSGLVSPGWGWQVSPEPHLPVYTPHGWPKLSAQVRQQPQPGSRTFSAQSRGRGLHRRRAAVSHGSHLTTAPTAPDPRPSESDATHRTAAHSATTREPITACEATGEETRDEEELGEVFHWSASHSHKAHGQNISIYRPH